MLQAAVDERIGDVLLQHLLAGLRHELRLEQGAGLAGGEHRIHLAGDVADVHQRPASLAPAGEQGGDAPFGLWVVARPVQAADTLLLVDDQQGTRRVLHGRIHFPIP
ncbi:hypothetical protein D9M70_651530 [compost metagenome]